MILAVAAYAGYIVVTMPDVESLQKKNPTITALMEQRAEEKDVAPRPIRAWIPYKSISPHLRNAVLIAEDSAFFQHSGYDFEQIKESAKRNWQEKGVARGGSTMRPQIAKTTDS